MCACMRALVHVSTGPTDRSLSFRFAASAFSRSSCLHQALRFIEAGITEACLAVLLQAADHMHTFCIACLLM